MSTASSEVLLKAEVIALHSLRSIIFTKPQSIKNVLVDQLKAHDAINCQLGKIEATLREKRRKLTARACKLEN